GRSRRAVSGPTPRGIAVRWPRLPRSLFRLSVRPGGGRMTGQVVSAPDRATPEFLRTRVVPCPSPRLLRTRIDHGSPGRPDGGWCNHKLTRPLAMRQRCPQADRPGKSPPLCRRTPFIPPETPGQALWVVVTDKLPSYCSSFHRLGKDRPGQGFLATPTGVRLP